MDFNEFVKSISPEMHENMKSAVATGRWSDGRVLSAEERETTLQAVIAYDMNNTEDKRERVGYIEPKKPGEKRNRDNDRQELKFS